MVEGDGQAAPPSRNQTQTHRCDGLRGGIPSTLRDPAQSGL